MKQEQYERIFTIAHAMREVYGIPCYRPGTVLETVQEICIQGVFPKVASFIGSEDVGFAKSLSVLSYLAPSPSGVIPKAVIDQGHQIVMSCARDLQDDEAIVDVGLAIAAGWGRQPAGDDRKWDQPWPQATRQLNQMAVASVERVLKGFADRKIIGAPRDFQYPELSVVEAYASECIAVFVGRKTVDRTRRDWHLLANWNPGPQQWLRLGRWLQRAIQGQPERQLRHIQANSFKEGLLYHAMEQHLTIDSGPLAFNRNRPAECMGRTAGQQVLEIDVS